MRTIIAGGRDCTNPYLLLEALDNCGWEPTCIISGMAKGADTLGVQYAEDCGIPLIRCYPAWNLPSGAFDRTAGFKRNEEMATLADGLIALWDSYSKGTADMINRAKKHKLRTFVYLYEKSSNQ